MPKNLSKNEFDIKWDKMMRYWDLISKYGEIRDTLWHEYPERMSESTKKLARYCLDSGYIKCKHE